VYTQLPDSSGITSRVDTGFTSSGLVTQINEFDYGSGGSPGSVVRMTATSYGSWNGSSCDSMGRILNRVCQVVVEDGSGNPKAKTSFTYDQGTPSSTGAPRHNTTPPDPSHRGNVTTVARWLNTTGGTLN